MAETLYTLVQILVAATAIAVLWYLYRNFIGADVLSNPEVLTKGQLRNVVGFAHMTMKNSAPGSDKYEDARRRYEAARAELDRRLEDR